MGRWSRAVASQLFEEVVIDPGAIWLDVGCGVGSLSGLVEERFGPSVLVGVDPSAAFVEQARIRVLGMTVARASAERLPFRADAFDHAISGLVLNFVPDPSAAVQEMARVVRPGGAVAAYIWDYDHPDFFLTRFWAALEAVTGRRHPHDERGRWPICTEDGLRRVVHGSSLVETRVRVLEVVTPFGDVEELWGGFLLGVGPSGAAATGLDRTTAERLRGWLHERTPAAGDGAVTLSARALAVTGRVPS